MIPGSIFHTIRDAGLLVIEEKPEELLHQIQLFLYSMPAVEFYRSIKTRIRLRYIFTPSLDFLIL
jgi:hypothetical protein